MAGRVIKWTDDRVAKIVEAVKAQGSLRLALPSLKEALGDEITLAQLRCALDARQISVTELTLEARKKREGLLTAKTPEAAAPGSDDPLAHEWRGYKPRPAMPPPPPAETRPGEVRRGVILGDAHVPSQDRVVEAVVLGIIREYKPHWGVQVGDLLDGEAISDYGTQRLDMSSWANECHEGNLFLDRLQEASPSTEWTLLGGNHDDPGEAGRPGKFAAKNPAVAELMDVRKQLFIEPKGYARGPEEELRGMRYVPVVRQPLIMGPLAVFHGIGYESITFARMIADRYVPANCFGKILFGGHMHTEAQAVSVAGQIYQCVGFIGDKRAPTFTYKTKRGVPASWCHSVTLVETVDEHVSYRVVRIVLGRALFDGKIVTSGR